MNNYITLYGEPLEYPHQVSVDKRGVAYYGFNMATERVMNKQITRLTLDVGLRDSYKVVFAKMGDGSEPDHRGKGRERRFFLCNAVGGDCI